MKSREETLCRECKEIITGRKIQFYQWSFHVKCWNNLMGLVENKNIVKEERLRVLIACEFSGIVRQAFTDRGHYALSCDLLPTEIPGNHYQGDVRDLLLPGQWDLMIAHPPCTHLATSGARYFHKKQKEQAEALEFVRELMAAPIDRICIENPVSVISGAIRPPDQVIQPYQFGHGEIKKTCLWLKNLPPLKPTNIVEGREARVAGLGPTKDRWKKRSRTLQGIAEAMADQWGKLTPVQGELF